MSVRRALILKNVAKGAGAIVVAAIALDLIASAVTVALGWGFFRR